jgi:hypothetical protein
MPQLSTEVMAWTAGVLLGAYALFILGVLVSPQRQHDPQRGQALGCLMIVLACLVTLGLVLAAGVYWGIRLLVYVPFCVAVFPVATVVVGGAVQLVRRARGR